MGRGQLPVRLRGRRSAGLPESNAQVGHGLHDRGAHLRGRVCRAGAVCLEIVDFLIYRILKRSRNGLKLYQVGDAYIDHDYWGRPEEMTMDRVVVVAAQ